MAPFPRPLHAPLHARPLSSSSCPVRTRPLSLPFSPFPPPGPAIIRSSIPGARPLSHSVRPAAAPVSPCAAAPFPSLFTIPRASFAKKRCPRRCGAPRGIPARAAGLTRRGRGPGFRACVARFCGLPRARGAGDGATVAAGHKTGLPRGRGAGIRRNGRQNRQAGPTRAGARRGYGPGFRACIVRFCGPTRAGGAGGGATVAAGHKTGLPRGRGAGIRRNGRQNRQAGPMSAVGGGGAAPASVLASFDFAACRAREGTRMAAQRSLPGIKPACRAGGARVSAGMVGEIVRPACRARERGGGAAPASVPAPLAFAVCRAREGRVAAQRSLPDIKPACRAGGARVSGGMVGEIVRPAR